MAGWPLAIPPFPPRAGLKLLSSKTGLPRRSRKQHYDCCLLSTSQLSRGERPFDALALWRATIEHSLSDMELESPSDAPSHSSTVCPLDGIAPRDPRSCILNTVSRLSDDHERAHPSAKPGLRSSQASLNPTLVAPLEEIELLNLFDCSDCSSPSLLTQLCRLAASSHRGLGKTAVGLWGFWQMSLIVWTGINFAGETTTSGGSVANHAGPTSPGHALAHPTWAPPRIGGCSLVQGLFANRRPPPRPERFTGRRPPGARFGPLSFEPPPGPSSASAAATRDSFGRFQSAQSPPARPRPHRLTPEVSTPNGTRPTAQETNSPLPVCPGSHDSSKEALDCSSSLRTESRGPLPTGAPQGLFPTSHAEHFARATRTRQLLYQGAVVLICVCLAICIAKLPISGTSARHLSATQHTSDGDAPELKIADCTGRPWSAVCCSQRGPTRRLPEMASSQSHMYPPRRGDEPTSYAHRAPTTRLPTRSVTPTTAVTSQLPTTTTQSKLQKRRPTRDDQVHQGRTITSQRVPAPKPSIGTKGRHGSATPTVTIARPSPNTTAPKTARQISSSRLPKLDVVGNTRTPSLVSGSSASTVDSPRSNVLRRKPSSLGITTGGQDIRAREGSMSSQEDAQPVKAILGGYRDPFSETVLGISLPPSANILAYSSAEVDAGVNAYDDYDAAPSEILPLPTPQYTLSTTPSTRYSESPGPFSVSSTPTSMSSYSPGVALSSKNTTRVRQASPLQGRPPVTRHRTPDEAVVRQKHALSAVRESSTSSSSASTILAEGGRTKERPPPVRLPVPPPTPPVQSPPTFSAASSSEGIVFSPSSTQHGYRSSPATDRQPKMQAPPELAHLADPPTTTPSGFHRPRRPSREGMPDITGLRDPSPVIQSNMTSFPSSHRRTPSAESKTGVLASNKSRFGIPKPSSRNPSPNPSLASGPPPMSRVPTRGPTPEVQSGAEKQRARTHPAPAPSPNKTSRFGFFTRRTKTEPAPQADKSEKKSRRGPAAGTGHEGYGRYALRGRSGSTASQSSIGRSASAGTTTESLNRTPSSRKSSMTSTTSTEMDDFFLERLRPVVIRGTGSSTELSRSPEPMHSGSSLDLDQHHGGDWKKTTSNSSRSALEQTRPTLLPSAMSDPVRGGSPMKRMPLGVRRPSESDDDAKKSFLPSLATRRASRSSKLMNGVPIGSAAGTNGTKARKASLANDISSEGKEGKWLKSKKADKAPSKPARKWNFFQRAHAAPREEQSAPDMSLDATASPARVAPSRSVAHYALTNQRFGIDLEEIEQLMQEADSAPEDPSTPAEPAPPEQTEDRSERLQSMLLPPKPIMLPHLAPPARSASPKVLLRPQVPSTQPRLAIDTSVLRPLQHPDASSPGDLTSVTDIEVSPSSSPLQPYSPIEATVPPLSPPISVPAPFPTALPLPGPPPSNPPPRPSRLPQVGRIPQVVSRRNQERRPPSQSFSRPFVAEQPRPAVPSRTSFDSAGSVLATAGPVEPYPVLQGLNALSHGTAIATLSPSAEESNRQSEFFKFPPRKDSEVSYSSSSGIWSFPAATGTAVIPSPGAPQSDDEVWNEYNDLIDEVLSPIDALNGLTETKLGKGKTASRHPSLEPLPLKVKPSHASSHSTSSLGRPSNPSLHLRRSRLLAVLHSAQSPTSPASFSDFLQEYGERNLSVVDPVTGRLSFPSTTRISTGSGSRTRPGSTRSSLPASLTLSARQSKATLASNSDKDRDSASANRYRDSRLMEIAETQSDGLVSMANLRFGALMTSKWLSFGRVIFSPAHFDLKDPSEDRVLVIDGLGKDWSYYCALTYSEATVYNLGPGASSSTATNSSTSEPWSTLRNHRHISHASLATPFPFPKGFFACVVLRFPPALPSSVHRSIISECKRVLRPGGYLELSVLDLDLVNMGNRARRAVRGLKVKMQVADEHVSLRNISDEIMAGLGRKGFTECNRCFVGVPVAGKLPPPEELEGPEGRKRKSSTASAGSKKQAMKKPKPEVSFSDLLNTQNPSESTDDGITDMVARVGRWWYSRCYESLVLPEAGEPGAATSGNLLESSIWRDESLIKECEKRGTSFRLLIGYAQKPEVGVRRTVSV
ncbi:hypothetical protein BDV96DRAFT_604158 [Lophiotrema nucula]|uniref:Methyltransferase type 11 domain-containing protein n=1 Tax=Lophiotrema nucula TaxID=690887 RepID=A0A6A5YVA3_9PLEO|nr:hypothetical protein BDV96DRAFT_604158 [Lophiotrema nucula]